MNELGARPRCSGLLPEGAPLMSRPAGWVDGERGVNPSSWRKRLPA